MEDDIKPKRGMVIVAHPDDAEWSCSGTVAKWCKEGMDVVYVICTNGNKGTDVPEINNRQLAEMRRQEQRGCCGRAGREGCDFSGLRGCDVDAVPRAS